MDFLKRNLEAAQQQARSLTLTASQSARGFAEQLSEQTKSLAEQAATVSTAAAEQASQRFQGLNLQEALQLRALQQTSTSQAGPSGRDLEQFAITPEFLEYIRSLTYSTFRDFPLEQLPKVGAGDKGAKALTPWQEKHALLVVQEVKEINELRFVLCPKRMTDTQFWQVYFTLAKKFLPAEAFDPSHVPPPADAPSSRVTELQDGLKRTFESARETAMEWSSRASGTLRPAETSAQLHDLVESRSRGNTPTAAGGGQRAADRPFAAATAAQPSNTPPPPDLDEDLEAYLRNIAHDAPEASTAERAHADGASESEPEDLDQYLNELETGDASRERDASSEDAVDLEEYMHELQGAEPEPA